MKPLLEGSLAAFPVWDILQWMSRREDAAWLELERPPSSAPGNRVSPAEVPAAAPRAENETGLVQGWLHLCTGRLESVGIRRDGLSRLPAKSRSLARAGSLGGWLVARGWLQEPQLRLGLRLQALLRMQTRGGHVPDQAVRLGQVLVGCGLLTREQLDEALHGLGFEWVRDLLSWRAGRFRYYAGSPAEAGLPVGERIETLLLRASQWLDEHEGGESGTPSL